MNNEKDTIKTLLSELMIDDKLTLSEVSEKVLYMKKKQEIERNYKNFIKTRSDGRAYVYIKRKQIVAPNYRALINKLYDMEYGRLNSSLYSLFNEWIIWKRDFTSVCDKTLKEDVNNWKRYLQNEPLSQVPLKDILPKDFIQLFRKWTKDRKMTRKKFNNVKSLINGIYYYAIEDGIVEHNPIKDINSKQFYFKPVNNNDDVFTVDERKKLLSYLVDNDDMYSLAIQLDFQLVLRIGELLSLRWSDIAYGNITFQKREMLDFTAFPAFSVSNLLLVQC